MKEYSVEIAKWNEKEKAYDYIYEVDTIEEKLSKKELLFRYKEYAIELGCEIRLVDDCLDVVEIVRI